MGAADPWARALADATEQPAPHAPARVRVLTLNLHKGFSALGRRDVLHAIRLAVRQVDADVVFLQEVMGQASEAGHSQYEFLADSIWGEHAYGRNAVSSLGHHGNAVLSRFPIAQWCNHDISVPAREPRGLLQCRLTLPGHPRPLHAFCVHLGLREAERCQQLHALARFLAPITAWDEPVVVAGDFNDWRHLGHHHLLSETALREVHDQAYGHLARTFPARWPLLALDRIYVAHTHHQHPLLLPNQPWAHLSDHAPLAAEIVL